MSTHESPRTDKRAGLSEGAFICPSSGQPCAPKCEGGMLDVCYADAMERDPSAFLDRLAAAEARADAAEARLAAVERLADAWNETPDYTPSTYDMGRVDQRHDMTLELLAALDADVRVQGTEAGA